MNGPLRRGRTPILGAQAPTLRWRISSEFNYGGPVIGRDGTVYMGTLYGQLLALRPDGTLQWSRQLPGAVESTPAILHDGRIAVVDSAGILHVFNPDGSLSWRMWSGETCACPGTSPAVGRDGTIYFGIGETVFAFRPDGSIGWTYDSGQQLTGSVAVGTDGSVYVPSGYLVALNPNGTLKWHTPDYLGLGGSPAIGSDGTIYVNASYPSVYAFNRNGTLQWSYTADDCCAADVPSSPAIDPDGTIYVGMTVVGDDLIVALTDQGSMIWQAQFAGRSPTALALGGDGTIYYGAYTDGLTGPLFALNPDGSLKWEYDDPGGAYVRTPPAIGLGRRVYAGSLNGFFSIGP